MTWQRTKIAAENNHHTLDGHQLYEVRFDEVLSFHDPGLASVRVGDKAWHITLDGKPAHTKNFDRTFGYYEKRAAVVQGVNWWHILPDGRDLYPERYLWAGNYQNGFCTVRTDEGTYFHIDVEGHPAYQERWRYAGDFKDDLAVVQTDSGHSTHIRPDGMKLHGCWFLDLDIFHKGYARAKDAKGWTHINRMGLPSYSRRFIMVEPFYNGHARVECFDGSLEIIDEAGQTVKRLREPQRSSFSDLSGKLVGYWQTKAIATAVELEVFENLGQGVEGIAKDCSVPTRRMLRLLRALQELQLVDEVNGIWKTTPQGDFLHRDNPLTLADAAIEYAYPLSHCWDNLPDALRSDDWQPSIDIFSEVARESKRIDSHHRMLRSYALHDYPAIVPLLPIEPNDLIVDAGGGTGTLARLVANAYPNVKVQILDHHQVLSLSETHPQISLLTRDLFDDWKTPVDVVILARVLHDWADGQALRILKQAHSSLRPGGRIAIVEMMREEGECAGALCDMHLLTVTGGEERTEGAYVDLLENAGFLVTEKAFRASSLCSVLVGRIQS